MKPQKSYDVPLLTLRVRQTIFCHFGPFFCPFTPLTIRKIKILKKMKKSNCGYYWFTLVYHKSYHAWFLRYGGRQAEFFVILDRFCSFTHLKTQKTKFWKNETYTSFYTCAPKIMIHVVWFLRYRARRTNGRKKWHIEVHAPTKYFLPMYPGSLSYQIINMTCLILLVLLFHNWYVNNALQAVSTKILWYYCDELL